MGYYTKYKLKVIAKDRAARDEKDNFDIWAENARDVFNGYASPDDLLKGYTSTWYDWNKDMLDLSKKYPGLIFQLDGSGQEGEFDEWRAFFKNGKYFEQKAELIFEKPDFSKLD